MLALGAAVGWATAIVLFKTVGDRLGPIALNTFKNLLAFVLIPPTMLLFGQEVLVDAPAADYGLLILSGVLGMGVSDTLYLMALNRLGAAVWAIANTLYAPMVVVMAMIFLGETLSVMQWAGVVLVLVALLLVGGEKRRNGNGKKAPDVPVKVRSGLFPKPKPAAAPAHAQLSRRDWLLGLTFAVLGMLSMAISVIIIKPVLDRSPVYWATEMRLAGGLLFLLVLIVANKRPGSLFKPWKDPYVIKRMFPAAFVGTYLALVLLQGGLKYTQASTATVLTQTSTLFIFVLAVVFLKEPVNLRRILGVVLGLGGAVLVIFGGV